MNSIKPLMSKSELKKYIKTLPKAQLEVQILALYEKFKPVKTYYDFVFNPNEKKMAAEARAKIAQEYFPVSTRKPKLRRSVAQKIVSHFITLEVDPNVIADTLLFSIEIAQIYTAEKPIKQEAFYKGIFAAFQQTLLFTQTHGLFSDFKFRFNKIVQEAQVQTWPNESQFEQLMDRLD